MQRDEADLQDLPVMSPILEIVDEARNGRMFILVDDENRENEGDLVIPAQMATPEAINFMARHGRGLICLALGEQRTRELGLSPMARHNQTPMQTAFTVSIEAKDGVSSGISAFDRAQTIATAINSANGPEAICSPGHVFPLTAREGGVLVRAGHTEAAVDIARLAGLNPSGVICEIMHDDGHMARLPDLMAFARRHHLKIGAIRDLIAFRRRHDHLVQCVMERSIAGLHGGAWSVRIFRNRAQGDEHLVLQKGEIDPERPTLVRMHNLSIVGDLLDAASSGSNCRVRLAMEAIAKAGAGVLVLLREATANSMSPQIGPASGDADRVLREYGIGAQILAELGIHGITLLTDSHHIYAGLEGYGLEIVGTQSLTQPETETCG